MIQQLELFPDDIRITRIDPDRNMWRFYRMHLQPDLFSGVTLYKQWGRIGTQGRQVAETFEDAGRAIDALTAHLRVKRRRGY